MNNLSQVLPEPELESHNYSVNDSTGVHLKKLTVFDSLHRQRVLPGSRENRPITPSEYSNEVKSCILRLLGRDEDDLKTTEKKELVNLVASFSKSAVNYWSQLRGNKVEQMKTKYQSFLDGEFVFKILKAKEIPKVAKSNVTKAKLTLDEKHKLNYPKYSKKYKETLIKELRGKCHDDLIKDAAIQITRQSLGGKNAEVIQRIMVEPGLGKKVEELLELEKPEKCHKEDAYKALLLLCELNLTKDKYLKLRKFLVSRKVNILPGWSTILKEKAKCYPPEEDMTFTDFTAEIKTQSLLNKTISRMVEDEAFSEEIKKIRDENGGQVQLNVYLKFGLDGSSQQHIYNQHGTGGNVACTNLVTSQFSLVQIQEDDTNAVVYTNALCNSSASHRPLRLAFEKETTANVRREYDRLQTEMANLEDFEAIEGVTFKYWPLPTLMDGKVLCNIYHVGTQRCPYCGATPTEMTANKLKPVIFKAIKHGGHGLGPLHFLERGGGFFLHLGYYGTLQMPQAAGDVNKAIKKEEKKNS